MATVMQLYLIGGVLAAAWLRLPPNPKRDARAHMGRDPGRADLALLLLVTVVMSFVPEEPEP
jgi:hypothetical protein